MPIKSKAQRAFLHAQKGKKVPAKVVEEMEAATPKGKKLPMKLPKPKKPRGGGY